MNSWMYVFLQNHVTVRPSVLEVLLEIAKICDVYLMEHVLDDESEVGLERAPVFSCYFIMLCTSILPSSYAYQIKFFISLSSLFWNLEFALLQVCASLPSLVFRADHFNLTPTHLN